jgi:hypothetical protein
MAADQPSVTKKRNSAAPVFFFHKCKSRRRASAICLLAVTAAIHRLFVRRVHSKLHLWPDRSAIVLALGQGAFHDPDFHFAQYRDPAHLAPDRRALSRINLEATNPGIVCSSGIKIIFLPSWFPD